MVEVEAFDGKPSPAGKVARPTAATDEESGFLAFKNDLSVKFVIDYRQYIVGV